MAKNAITDYDTNPANNTDVGSIGVQGTNIPSNFDNSQREIMSHLADMNAGTSPLHDTFAVADPADLTKKVRIDAGNVTAGETRVINVPDEDITLYVNDDNLVINGNFQVNQDEVSGTVVLAVGEYGHDMWKAGSSGCTYTFATVENVTTITISAGSLQQVIEGKFLDSGTHCLAWTGTAQGKIDAGSYGSTGVTGTATGGTNLTIEFNTGTLTNVSLIKGAIAGNYKRRMLSDEKRMCRYFYQKSTVDAYYQLPSSSGSQIQRQTVYFDTMRDSPTISTTKNAGSAVVAAVQAVGVNGFRVALTGSQFSYAEYSWSADARL